MKKLFIIIIFFASVSLSGWACSNAHLFKIFPIGTCGDTIISVDIRIDRGMFVAPPTDITIIRNKSKGSDIVWIIESYITKYDELQNPIEITPVDTLFINAYECEKELELIYEKAYSNALAKNKNIELFQTDSISFGNFENKYKNVEIKDNIILYDNEPYTIDIRRDTTYYGFDIPSYFSHSHLAPIGSIRKYTSKHIELIVIHTQAGSKFVEQKLPEVKFSHVSDAIYLEPILYHGNGIDYFIVRKKKK